MARNFAACVTSAFVLGLLNRSVSAQQRCVVVPFPAANEGYEYAANFTQLGVCSAADFTVSRLYLDQACLQNRDNSANPDCSREGGTVNDTTAACDAVFADGTVLQLNNITDPTDCLVDADAYHHGAAIAVAVAACAFLLILIGGWGFWYRRSRRRSMAYQPQQDINMQPYEHDGSSYLSSYSSSLPAQQAPTNERIPGYPASGTVQGTVAQGTPVYSPWTGGGFKPERQQAE